MIGSSEVMKQLQTRNPRYPEQNNKDQQIPDNRTFPQKHIPSLWGFESDPYMARPASTSHPPFQRRQGYEDRQAIPKARCSLFLPQTSPTSATPNNDILTTYTVPSTRSVIPPITQGTWNWDGGSIVCPSSEKEKSYPSKPSLPYWSQRA